MKRKKSNAELRFHEPTVNDDDDEEILDLDAKEIFRSRFHPKEKRHMPLTDQYRRVTLQEIRQARSWGWGIEREGTRQDGLLNEYDDQDLMDSNTIFGRLR